MNKLLTECLPTEAFDETELLRLAASGEQTSEHQLARGRDLALGRVDEFASATGGGGIAMGTGSDVAIESAGVTLAKGDLSGIVKAVQLSRHTVRNIRQTEPPRGIAPPGSCE